MFLFFCRHRLEVETEAGKAAVVSPTSTEEDNEPTPSIYTQTSITSKPTTTTTTTTTKTSPGRKVLPLDTSSASESFHEVLKSQTKKAVSKQRFAILDTTRRIQLAKALVTYGLPGIFSAFVLIFFSVGLHLGGC